MRAPPAFSRSRGRIFRRTLPLRSSSPARRAPGRRSSWRSGGRCRSQSLRRGAFLPVTAMPSASSSAAIPVFLSSFTMAARRSLSLMRRWATFRMRLRPGRSAAEHRQGRHHVGHGAQVEGHLPSRAARRPVISTAFSPRRTRQPSRSRSARKPMSPWPVRGLMFSTRTRPFSRAAARKK